LGLSLGGAVPGRQTLTSRPGDREMIVSVLDKQGVPVTDLTADDFLVREDGVRREVLRAGRATGPITLALLVDTSQAASPYMADIRRALGTFLQRMGGANLVALTTFGERPSILVDYTTSVAALERGVGRLFALRGSGAYFLDAVAEICKGLSKRDVDRAVILAIGTGGPEFSTRLCRDLLPQLRDSGAALDVLVVNGNTLDTSSEGRERALFLDEGPRATGGTRANLLTSMALDAALARLASELTNQYRIVYARPDALIPPTHIEVTVRRPGLVARGTPVKPSRP
jgi:Ca-activated chloride channel family protein